MEVGYIYLREFTTKGDRPETFLVNMGWIPKSMKQRYIDQNMKQEKEVIGLLKRSEKNNVSQAQMELEEDLDGMYQIDLELLSHHTHNTIDKSLFIGKLVQV